MWTIRYISAILVVTILTAIAGAVLWNSEDQQVLSDDMSETCEGWLKGTTDAPVELKSFADFT